MSLNNMTKDQLEILSYTDLTEMILKEGKTAMNTPTIFKQICKLLELSDEEYTSKIGEFYTSLTTDKRFILLDDARWDLRDKHSIDIIIDTEEDEEEDDDEVDDSVVETVESEDIDEMEDEEGIEQDDEIEDLTIIDDEDMDDDE